MFSFVICYYSPHKNIIIIIITVIILIIVLTTSFQYLHGLDKGRYFYSWVLFVTKLDMFLNKEIFPVHPWKMMKSSLNRHIFIQVCQQTFVWWLLYLHLVCTYQDKKSETHVMCMCMCVYTHNRLFSMYQILLTKHWTACGYSKGYWLIVSTWQEWTQNHMISKWSS